MKRLKAKSGGRQDLHNIFSHTRVCRGYLAVLHYVVRLSEIAAAERGNDEIGEEDGNNTLRTSIVRKRKEHQHG